MEDDEPREARRPERFQGEKRRQVVTACAPCRISHRCCDEPRPCRRCKRLGLTCLPGETPLTAELIEEDKRQRMNSRKKKKLDRKAGEEAEPEKEEETRTAPPAAPAAAAGPQEILPSDDPQFNLLESVPRSLPPPADGAPTLSHPGGMEQHVGSLTNSALPPGWAILQPAPGFAGHQMMQMMPHHFPHLGALAAAQHYNSSLAALPPPQGYIIVPVAHSQSFDPSSPLSLVAMPPPLPPPPGSVPHAPPQTHSAAQSLSLTTRDSVDILLNLSTSLGLDAANANPPKKHEQPI